MKVLITGCTASHASKNTNEKMPSFATNINSALTDNYNTYTNPNNPYAELQDTNYRLNSFTVPRYYGSKTISATYNDYTVGDESYGSTAAIDKIKFQYAYLKNVRC
jgi:hypothetical protein